MPAILIGRRRARGRARGGRVTLRRGNALMMVTISLTVVMGMGALAIDLGYMQVVRAELQRSADAAALAGAGRLLDQDRLRGDAYLADVISDSRLTAKLLAQQNKVDNREVVIDASQDVVLGNWDFDSAALTGALPAACNGVEVSLFRDDLHGGQLSFSLAQLLGRSSSSASARATAAFSDGIRGFRVTENSGNAELLPFALHVNTWNMLLAGQGTPRDTYFYNKETGAVFSGADGIRELNLYPGAGTGQLPPGNFGTVDIGSPNNSTADIARQIVSGISAADLAYFGGKLELNDDGVLMLNGDTGISAGIKDELASIIGQPRIIPLFRSVSGPGNNAMFEIVAFAGIRILDVKLTGSMKSKYLMIQPAIVVDDSAIAGDSGTSHYVYRPPHLVR